MAGMNNDRKRKELREKIEFLREEFRRTLPEATVGTYKRPARSDMPVQEFTYIVRGSKINGKNPKKDTDLHAQENPRARIRLKSSRDLRADRPNNKRLWGRAY